MSDDKRARATALKFSRRVSGRYVANGETLTYVVARVGAKWRLAIHTTYTLDLVVNADWHETKALAVATARMFENLGDEGHGFTSPSRLAQAVTAAYAEAE